MAAIQVSVDAVDETLQQRYRDLAVFRDDTPVPEAVFETFWAPAAYWTTTTSRTHSTCLSTAPWHGGTRKGRITLHDLQFNYVSGKVGAAN